MCAVLIIPASARADDPGVQGFGLLELTQTRARNSAANPDDLFDAGIDTGELALGLEGKFSGVRWRARLTADGARSDGWPSEHNLSLKELYYSWSSDGAWHFSAGQQLLTWDNGLSFQPLGFLKSSQTDLRDVFDTEGRSQGLPMMVATYLGEHITTDIVVSTNNPDSNEAEQSNARQLAIRWSGELTPGLNSALILRKRDGARVGIGESTSYGVDEVTLRADAYYGPAEAREFPVGLFNGPAQLYVPPVEFTYDPGHDYQLRSVAGATWTPDRGLVLNAEWVHHGDGLTSNQWNLYNQQLAVHTAALNGPYYGAAVGNLGTDLSVLSSAPAGVRRDYLYLRAEMGQGDSTWYLSTFAGMADRSAMTTLSKTWKLRSHMTLRADLSAFTGSANSEFGLTPYKYQADLVLLRTF